MWIKGGGVKMIFIKILFASDVFHPSNRIVFF